MKKVLILLLLIVGITAFGRDKVSQEQHIKYVTMIRNEIDKNMPYNIAEYTLEVPRIDIDRIYANLEKTNYEVVEIHAYMEGYDLKLKLIK